MKKLIYILILMLVVGVRARDRDIYPLADQPIFKVGTVGPAGQHNILSAVHADSAVSASARGSLLVRNSTSNWARLSGGTALPGAATHYFGWDGTDVGYRTIAGIVSDTGVLLADGSVALAGAWDMGSQATTNVNIDSGVITGITDLALADGGTGASLSDPGADRIFFWDDGGTTTAFLTANTNISITGTDLNVDDAFLINDGNDTTTGILTAAGFIGAITGDLTGNADTASALADANSISMSGDVVWTVSFDGSADVTSGGVIQPDSVALPTDTTGNYVATIADAGNSSMTVANSGTENAAVTLDVIDDGHDHTASSVTGFMLDVGTPTANTLVKVAADGFTTTTTGIVSDGSGNLSAVGNITGTDIDMELGTGDFNSTGTIDSGKITVTAIGNILTATGNNADFNRIIIRNFTWVIHKNITKGFINCMNQLDMSPSSAWCSTTFAIYF